ncbi:Isoamyl acetate-hydrolyzing esterase 1-like protein, partial [Lachnellula suecica]
VSYILLLLGSNDSCLPSSPTKQHIPLEQYRSNLHAIINHPAIKAHEDAVILLVTPPPVNEVHLEKEDLKMGNGALTRRQEVTKQYVDVARSIAGEYAGKGVELVDLWSALMDEGKRLTPGFEESGALLGTNEKGDSEGLRSLLVDGLHLTGAGYKVFWEQVRPHVGKGWADEPLDNPSWLFPHWSVAPSDE